MFFNFKAISVVSMAVGLLCILMGPTAVSALDASDLAGLGSDLTADREALFESYAEGDAVRFGETVERIFSFAAEESALGGEVNEYVILAPDASFASPLHRFKTLKENEGFTVYLHDLDSELGPDADNPHSVRELLRSQYLDGKLRYLLIVGHRTLIPMLEAYSLTSGTMLTDLYYADLEGDWDADDDGIFGEAIDDAIDFIPEFICSRIPCKTVDEGFYMLGNGIKYQRASHPGKDAGILMAGTISVQGETGLLQNVIAWLLQRRDFASTRMFDTDTFSFGSVEMPLYPDYLLGETPVPVVWNKGQQSFVFDISHGSPYGVAGFSFDEIAALDLDLNGWFVAAACAICEPVAYGRNFAEELAFTGGLGGVIGSTDIVNPGEGYRLVSGIFSEVGFALAAVNPDNTMGRAFNTITVLYNILFMALEQDPYWYEMKAQNLKGFHLMGDASGFLR